MTDAWNIWRGYVALLFALCISQQAFAVAIVGRVMRVSDGDTVWVTDAAKLKHKVRLNRIDAPEKDQPWGKESAAKRYPDGSQAGFGGLLALDRASISETF